MPHAVSAEHEPEFADLMHDSLSALTEREKETLRLLLVGHDAKSIAVRSSLSVHTVNERLRDARRKLGVSSSREAARLLAESEQNDPHFLGDNELGVPGEAADVFPLPATRPPYSAHRLVWFGGGMLIMSLIIAAAILASVTHTSDASALQETQSSPADAHSTAHPAGLDAARDWIVLLDSQRWNESWDKAGPLFQAGIPASQWAAMVRSVREPLGAVAARSFKSATEATSLPGAPIGQYEIIQFHTDFTGKPEAIETVVMAHDVSGWKVAGYFIK